MGARRDRRARQVRREERLPPSYRGRRWTVLGFFLGAAALLVWRAVDQQIFEKDFLQSEGADRYVERVKVPAHRGLITDRRGAILAASTPVDSVGADPVRLPRDDRVLVPLAEALGMQTEELRRRLSRYAGRRFVYLKRRLPPHRAEAVERLVKALHIPGVQMEREYRRYYPAGEVFAHVIGFTGVDDLGQEGLELAYDQALRGEPGAKRVLRDGRRQVVADVANIRMPRPGSNLALSIDRRLQFIAYRALKAAVRQHRAKAGSAVMLDVRSGEVLAMVNQPSYNPNGSRSNKGGRLRNRVATDTFEPGSTMKPFTVATALELGRYRPDSPIDTTPGYFKVGRRLIRDHNNLGQIDVTTVITKSSNVGAGKIALELPKEALWERLRAFGFGEGSGSGYPGEATGTLRPPEEWARIDQATLAYGYGISVTVLQLAEAYAVLAADGLRRPLSLLRRERPPEARRVLSAGTARALRRMLETVVAEGGTAPQARVPGYRVAGKTGTGKKYSRKGYSEKKYRALFAGMAPASDPRLVMVVMVDEPRAGKYYGGQVAAPVFARAMGEALRLLNVAPDDVPGGTARLVALETGP